MAGFLIGGTGATNGLVGPGFGRVAGLVGRGVGQVRLPGSIGIGGSGRTIGRGDGRVCALPSVAQPASPRPSTTTPAIAWNGRMSLSPGTRP